MAKKRSVLAAVAVACVLAGCDAGVLAPKVEGGSPQPAEETSSAQFEEVPTTSTTSSQTGSASAAAETGERPQSSDKPSEGASATSTAPQDSSSSASSAAPTGATSPKEPATKEELDLTELLTPQVPDEPLSGGVPRSVTVTGNASISAVPDKASFTVSLTTQAATTTDAEVEHAKTVLAIAEALEEVGVDETAVQTVYTNLSPVYGTPEPAAETSSEPAAEAAAETTAETDEAAVPTPPASDVPVVVAYEMSTTLSVSEVDVEEVGDVMSICIAAGATGVGGPDYYVSNYDELYEDALVEAVLAARAKAEILAGAAGARVGQVITLDEGYQDQGYRAKGTGLMQSAAVADEATLQLSPGEVSVDATVTVSYVLL